MFAALQELAALKDLRTTQLFLPTVNKLVSYLIYDAQIQTIS